MGLQISVSYLDILSLSTFFSDLLTSELSLGFRMCSLPWLLLLLFGLCFFSSLGKWGESYFGDITSLLFLFSPYSLCSSFNDSFHSLHKSRWPISAPPPADILLPKPFNNHRTLKKTTVLMTNQLLTGDFSRITNNFTVYFSNMKGCMGDWTQENDHWWSVSEGERSIYLQCNIPLMHHTATQHAWKTD